ncbi:hypothetical protein MVEG_12372 [Podila verticillata NRRL 6337]|uniref:Heterokaryon incompatibility domain-containing protein n=1 Tax=Podila verticillata NRRL 6337 TaxID=1069443 RepID=A0A086TIL2_9FUNG|nr:hypothetical protein MVEG_12372 [Podila verticillata NRRL 6337]
MYHFRDKWVSTIESLDIQHNSVDISSYLSLVTPQAELGIRAHIQGLGYNAEAITAKQLIPLIDVTRSLFFIQDLGFCDKQSFAFLMLLASYIAETGCTIKNIADVFGIGAINKLCMTRDGKNMSIGMAAKLFGLGKVGNMSKMDCPRVWDLELDEVITNPNIEGDPVHQIAVITHRWQKEFVYKDLMKIETINSLLEELGRPTKSIKISPMSPKLTKIRDELKSQIRYIWMDTLCIDKPAPSNWI